MAEATKQTASETKLRDFEIVTPIGKAKREVTGLLPVRILFAIIGPLWAIRFAMFMSKKSYAWNNRLWRQREKKYFPFYLLGSAGCWIVGYAWLALLVQGEPNAYGQFWVWWILNCLVLNPLSRRWQKPSFEKFMEMPKRRLKLIESPDASANGYPIGWTPELGWIYYGFRTPNHPPEFYPCHNVKFGKYGMGQEGSALNDIRSAFETLKSPVVLILDSDAGGIDFAALKDLRGIVVYDRHADCERAIWYVAQVIKQRRKYLDKSAPNIVVIADMWFGAAMIGKNPELAHLHGAIKTIIEEGNQFGVNVIAFPPAQFFYNAVDLNLKFHFDRAQFYTTARYPVPQENGKIIERSVESPRPFTDLFLWTINGETYECKALIPTIEQVIYRVRMTSYAEPSRVLWNKFAMFDFPELRPMPDFKKQSDEEPEMSESQAEMLKRMMKQVLYKTSGQSKELFIGAPENEYMPQPNGESADASQ